MTLRALLCLFLIGLPFSADAYSGFRRAASPMEVAAAKAVAHVDQNSGWAQYLLYHDKPDPAVDAINNQLFTQDLLADWLEQESLRVYRRCGGKYINGKQCGFPYNPLTCLSFVPPTGYLFRTDSSVPYSEGAFNGTVSMLIAGGAEISATYSMKLVNKQWLIDGVDCHVEQQTFNGDSDFIAE